MSAEQPDLADLEKHPGYRTVDVTLIIHTTERVPKGWDDESVRFYIEENHCLGNYTRRIHEQEDAKAKEMGLSDSGGICNLCGQAEAYVGHLPFPEHK